MKLTKVYRSLKFKQNDWLKKYTDFNTDKRQNVANNFEKDFFKQMHNSVFGKTMENLRKIIFIKLVNNSKNYVRYISKPSFISQKLFNKNFVAIHEIKPVLILNKPIYVGFSVLDLSKLLIYEFNYKDIKSKFDAKLFFTDTDNLVYETEDVYEDFYQDKNLFDFIDYPLDSKFFDPANKKVIGKMKDEFKGKKNNELVGLKSRMYSSISVDDEEVTKAKGVGKKIRQKEIVDVLFNKKVIRHRIQKKLQIIGTYDVCKISLSCFDDKRCVLDYGVNTLAYFYKDIKN